MVMLPFKIKPNWQPTVPCPLTQLLLPLQQLILMIALSNIKISHWTYIMSTYSTSFASFWMHAWTFLTKVWKWPWCPFKFAEMALVPWQSKGHFARCPSYGPQNGHTPLDLNSWPVTDMLIIQVIHTQWYLFLLSQACRCSFGNEALTDYAFQL